MLLRLAVVLYIWLPNQIQQERANWAPRRFDSMNRKLLLGIAALVVLAAVVYATGEPGSQMTCTYVSSGAQTVCNVDENSVFYCDDGNVYPPEMGDMKAYAITVDQMGCASGGNPVPDKAYAIDIGPFGDKAYAITVDAVTI